MSRRVARKHDLAPLADRDTRARSSASGTLWGLPDGAGVGSGARGQTITLPSYGRLRPGVSADRRRGAGSRAATRSTSRRTPARSFSRCSTRTASTRLSQIRIWNVGRPNNQIRIGDVRLTGGCGQHRRVLRHAARRARRTAASAHDVYVNWGDRDNPPNLNVPANFTVTVNGVPADIAGRPQRPGRRIDPLYRARQRDHRQPGRQRRAR